MNIAVIGAGISGISVAKLLKNHASTVTVFEKADRIGGLIKCDYVDGNLYHRVGGHVFNAKNKDVAQWFWSKFDQDNEFYKAKRNAKIWFKDSYIGYPIENYLYQLDRASVETIISEILSLQAKGYKAPDAYPNFEAFLIGNFGQHLYDIYFKPYNNKIWNIDLTTVALEWLEGKLPMPNYHQMIVSNIVKQEEDTMVHSNFFYPKQGGSQFIIDRLAQDVDVAVSSSLTSLVVDSQGLLLTNVGIFDSLVYTGDIRNLISIIHRPSERLNVLLHQAQNLKSHGTTNVLCQTDDTDISWLYVPHEGIDSHRIIYTGNFSPSNNKEGGRKTCTVEFSGNVSIEEIQRQIHLLPGSLEILAYNYEPNSYVIQAHDTRALIAEIKLELAKSRIYLLGRFAEWEYYNMDKAIEAASDLAHKYFSIQD